jgi:phytanoyl-CoA hydroxylase
MEQTTEALKAAFDRDGYVVVRGLFSGATWDALYSHYNRYLTEVLPTLPAKMAFYDDRDKPETLFRLEDMSPHDPWFRDVLTTGRVPELASVLLGDDAEPHAAQMFGKAPRTGGPTPPHQDGYYFMLEPNEALTVWTPACATTNGARSSASRCGYPTSPMTMARSRWSRSRPATPSSTTA